MENILKRMPKNCLECWVMFKLKENFYKHPKTMPRGYKKVKNRQRKWTNSLFMVEPFLKKYGSD